MEIVPIIAGAVAILTGLVKAGSWIATKRRARKTLKAERAAAALPPPAPRYPVRFTCRANEDYHPSSGYREILEFEVYNDSERPVTVKGFGLDVTMHAQSEWHEHEQAYRPGGQPLPIRLEPYEAIEGYIDTEALADEITERGEREYVVRWDPYLELAGHGKLIVEIDKSAV